MFTARSMDQVSGDDIIKLLIGSWIRDFSTNNLVNLFNSVKLGAPYKEKEEVDVREASLLVFNREHASNMFSKDTVLPYLA